MIAVTSALMLMLANAQGSTPADAMGKARKEYSACLSRYTQDAREREMNAADYKTGLKEKCAEMEATFRAAILAADKVDGMPPKAAAADASDQVSEYLEKFSSEYEDNTPAAAPKPTG